MFLIDFYLEITQLRSFTGFLPAHIALLDAKWRLRVGPMFMTSRTIWAFYNYYISSGDYFKLPGADLQLGIGMGQQGGGDTASCHVTKIGTRGLCGEGPGLLAAELVIPKVEISTR